MKQLYPAMDIDEARYIFDSMDKLHAGKIVYESIIELFKANNINLTSLKNIPVSPTKRLLEPV